MNRVLSAVSSLVVVVLSSCGGGAGRCTADSQCPVGSSCDETVGVCVMPGSGSSNGGGSGATGGGSGGNPSMISADYGKSCTSDSNCSSVPGTTCTPNVNQCLATCANGQACPIGSECVDDVNVNRCVRTCSTHSDCSSEQYCNESSYISSKVCLTKVEKWSLGKDCTSDSDCESSAFCVKKTGQSTGVCTKDCQRVTDCAEGQECVGLSGDPAFCFDFCFGIGQTSTCRNGMSCRAINGVSYGFCG